MIFISTNFPSISTLSTQETISKDGVEIRTRAKSNFPLSNDMSSERR